MNGFIGSGFEAIRRRGFFIGKLNAETMEMHKNLSVISDNLGSRRHPAGIARYKLGENIFQDASDQVVDCLGCVLGED
jgi:hypothetical protein